MNLIPVTDARFKKYGRIVKDVDFKELIEEMKKTPCPEDVIYVASVPELEALPVFDELVDALTARCRYRSVTAMEKTSF